MRLVEVVEYDPNWKDEFEKIKGELLNVLDGYVIAIEHVGSTSVELLAAKPIIDIDIVMKDYNSFELIKGKLSEIGYSYEGDLGIKDRHTFKYSDKPHLMNHHLYCCPEYSEELKRHISFRDYLITHPKDVKWYSSEKLRIAEYYPFDIDKYMIAKAPVVAEILRKSETQQ
ncbi:MAG: GrpB family protein [Oscillospiraceae bacterium]|nr:GrpB family protein [Oscillospiraceae bacterium]